MSWMKRVACGLLLLVAAKSTVDTVVCKTFGKFEKPTNAQRLGTAAAILRYALSENRQKYCEMMQEWSKKTCQRMAAQIEALTGICDSLLA